MARITARQAFSRVRAKRRPIDMANPSRVMRQSYMINRTVAIPQGNETNQENHLRRPQTRRADSIESTPKKNMRITDFFYKTSSPRAAFGMKNRIQTTSEIGRDGIETITIHESDNDCSRITPTDSPLSNNTCNIQCTDIKRERSSSQSHEDDVLIIEVLPPIPLRDHPVHNID